MSSDDTALTRLSAAVAVIIAGMLAAAAPVRAADVLTTDDLLRIKSVGEARISPDGQWVAYTVRSIRKPTDKAGSDYRELLVASNKGESRPYVTGETAVFEPRWSPDGSQIAFRMQRGEKAKTQVWVIAADGGEARQVTHSETSVSTFRWHPDGGRIAYVAATAPSKTEKKLKDKGYGFVFYEEDLEHRNLQSIVVGPADEKAKPETLSENITVWTFEYSPDGRRIAVGASERNLVDHRYAFQKVYLVDPASKSVTRLTDNPGKIGNFAFSPNGAKLAYAAGRDQRDHAVSHLYVIDGGGGDAKDLTPRDFKGHVDWVGWRDDNTILYRSAEGVWNNLNVVTATGQNHRTILDGKKSGVVFGTPTYTKNFRHFAMTGSAPDVPGEVYRWTPSKSPVRLTNVNPWLAGRELGRVEVVRYAARDGLEIEGLLYYPVGYQKGTGYPLIVVVHGGPESRFTNGWPSYYSRPVYCLTGKGYAVFLPNYRSSTGYGVDFTKDHLGNAAGKEFDDIADGIEFLVGQGVADRDRVGLMGGSYGGYAAAWFSSYYTDYARAVCMFVGISNLVSKRGTTDIPYEELFVHSGAKLEDMWALSLERSPIYHAHKSKTAVLIYGGTADTRVHPAQSLEYYRRLKMNDHPAVRLVQYPGEGHGNSKQPGKIDVLHRTLQWFDWYVKDKKPLDGPMPPLDISDAYGLKLGDE